MVVAIDVEVCAFYIAPSSTDHPSTMTEEENDQDERKDTLALIWVHG